MPIPYHILLVEDDTEQMMLFALILKKSGYTVTRAPDAEAALAQLESGKFDLLLTDLLLPGMNGDQLIAQVKERQYPLKTILMSTHVRVDEEAVACAADGFYRKGDLFQLPKLIASKLAPVS